MNIIPGLMYEGTKERLKQAINEGAISALEVEAGNFASYFSGKSIKDNAITLIERDPRGTTRYFISREEYLACNPNNEKLSRFHEGNTTMH